MVISIQLTSAEDGIISTGCDGRDGRYRDRCSRSGHDYDRAIKRERERERESCLVLYFFSIYVFVSVSSVMSCSF